MFPCLQRIRAFGPTAYIVSFPERHTKIAAELHVPQAEPDITYTYCCESSRQLPMNMRIAASGQLSHTTLVALVRAGGAASVARHSQRRCRSPAVAASRATKQAVTSEISPACKPSGLEKTKSGTSASAS